MAAYIVLKNEFCRAAGYRQGTRRNFLKAVLIERPDRQNQLFTEKKGGFGDILLFGRKEAFKGADNLSVCPFLEQEHQVLRYLEPLNLPIPRVTHVGQEAHFFGMTYLPGRNLALRDLNDPASLKKIARGVSRFAISLAAAFPDIAEASRLIQVRYNPTLPVSKTLDLLETPAAHKAFGPLTPKFQRAMQEYESRIAGQPPIVIHSDLKPGNIRLDRKTGEVSGVLDFGGMNICPPAGLFAEIFPWVEPRVVRTLCNAWRAEGGQPITVRDTGLHTMASALRHRLVSYNVDHNHWYEKRAVRALGQLKF